MTKKQWKRDKFGECVACVHMRTIPGDAHIQCGKPDKSMEGAERGVSQGWFNYPWNFDPVWKLKLCKNFKKAKIK